MNPSVTTTSAAPVSRSRPSTLPAKAIASEPASASFASTTSGRPFFCSSPTESRADARRLHPQDGLGEGGAEEGELDQVLRAGLGVGAGVEEDERLLAARDRDLHGERRPVNALDPLEREQRGGHGRPGGSGADQRRGVALGDVGGRADHGGVGLRPHGGHRLRVVVRSKSSVSTTSTPSAEGSPEGPNSLTAIPSAAAMRAPSRTSSGPPSAPCPSNATGPAVGDTYSSVCVGSTRGSDCSGSVKLITSRPA